MLSLEYYYYRPTSTQLTRSVAKNFLIQALRLPPSSSVQIQLNVMEFWLALSTLTKTMASFYLGQASQIPCLPMTVSSEFQFAFIAQGFSWFHVLGFTSVWVLDND